MSDSTGNVRGLSDELQHQSSAALSAAVQCQGGIEQGGSFTQNLEPVMAFLWGGVGPADAVVFDVQGHLTEAIGFQADLGPGGLSVSFDIDQRFTDQTDQMNFFMSAQFEAVHALCQKNFEAATSRSFFHHVFQSFGKWGLSGAETEGREQFTQFTVGAVQPRFEFGDGGLEFGGELWIETALQQGNLNLEIGQGLCQGVMQFASDDGALLVNGQAMAFLGAARIGQSGGDMARQGLQDTGLPGEQGVPGFDLERHDPLPLSSSGEWDADQA